MPAILDGTKDQTLRQNRRSSTVSGARLALLNGYRPGAKFAEAIIDTVDLVSVAELSETDARRDGFSSRDELLARLRRDGVASDQKLWRIRWRALTPAPGVAPPD